MSKTVGPHLQFDAFPSCPVPSFPSLQRRPSALALCSQVGLTSAIGLTRVMDAGAAPLAGVLAPTEKSVYEYALAKLAEEGLGFLEATKVG